MVGRREKIATVAAAYQSLPAAWDDEVEDRIYGLLFDVFRNKRHLARELPPIKPTVAEILDDPANLTFVMSSYDPDYDVFADDEILNYRESVAELESLGRWAMVLHNQYPWDRTTTRLVEVAKIDADDFVVVFHPRDREVARLHPAGQVRCPPAPPPPSVPGRQSRLGRQCDPIRRSKYASVSR